MADVAKCYTESGDKKIYEPDLFKAQLDVYSHEYVYRHDSNDSKTLVFGKLSEENDGFEQDHFTSYLPCCGISINHNIQANGEDHYSLSATYIKPGNWSPPAGLDGPFDLPSDLEYPYYEHTIGWSYRVDTWYNGKYNCLSVSFANIDLHYYGNKE